jgi:hypothetical protein
MGRDENFMGRRAPLGVRSGRGREWMRIAGRIAFLSALVLVVPACGDHAKDQASEIASDGFAPFPDYHWGNPVLSGNAMVVQATAVGDPAPSMEISTLTNPGAGTGTITSTGSWNTPVTISIEEAMVGTSGDPGIGTITILEGGAPIASVVWDNGGNTLTFTINGVVAPVPPAPKAAPQPDGTFYFFAFAVDALGNASWTYGTQTIQTYAGFPPGALSIELSGAFAAPLADGTLPNIYFDNLIVTVPP